MCKLIKTVKRSLYLNKRRVKRKKVNRINKMKLITVKKYIK